MREDLRSTPNLYDTYEKIVSDETSPLISYHSTTSTIDKHDAKHTKLTITGMICVAVGTLFICTGGSIAAIIGGSVLEIMLGRYIIQLLLSLIWWCIKQPNGSQKWFGDRGNRLNIWIRGFLYFILVFGWYRGLELVPIGDAEGIIFLAPILIVFVARFVLKEELPQVFPLTLLLTIAGIIFVCQPEFIFGATGSVRPVSIAGLIFLIIMAVAWAFTSILVRTAQSAHWLQIQIVACVQGTFIWTPILILLNRFIFHSDLLSGGKWMIVVDAKRIGLIIVCALCGFVGLSLNVVGYQIGDATKVAQMEYFDLIFAFIFQWCMFGIAPNLWEWLGFACLLSTCVIHLIEEVIKYRRNVS